MNYVPNWQIELRIELETVNDDSLIIHNRLQKTLLDRWGIRGLGANRELLTEEATWDREESADWWTTSTSKI